MPSDRELRASLAATFGPVVHVERRPHAYATSSPLEELVVRLADGSVRTLVLKDLRRDRLQPAARRAKPAFLHDPKREIATYRDVLAGADLGTPALHAADGSWLALEKVSGTQLWQIGDLDTWERVAATLARLHGQLAERARAPHLLVYDERWYRLWLDRARATVDLPPGVERAHARAADLLLRLPLTVIHGELYASNVLVDGDRVCIVDWETAACGPGVVDLAALVTGWGDAELAAIAAAYGDVPAGALAAARLHLAVRWLGWSRSWRPPPEHRRNWLAEAVSAAGELSP